MACSPRLATLFAGSGPACVCCCCGRRASSPPADVSRRCPPGAGGSVAWVRRPRRAGRGPKSSLNFSAATLEAFARASSETSSSASQPALPAPSCDRSQITSELAELGQIQLELLADMIPEHEMYGAVVATLYVRVAHSFESGTLELMRIASCGPAAPGSLGRAHVESVQTDTGSVVIGATSPSASEEGLVSQAWIALPETGSIVMPLSWGPLLVGLLLVERSHATASASAPLLSSGGSAEDFGEASVVPDLFSPSESQKLLKVARSLTIACFLDSKLGVLQQQQSAGSRHVSGLVEDARAPLQALCTLGGMLAPRLEEGEPEQDMANAMLVQGERLKSVIQQLQDAFRPAAPEAEALPGAPRYYAGGPATPQLAAALNRAPEMPRLLASPSVARLDRQLRRIGEGAEGGGGGGEEEEEAEWCNVTSTLSDMLVGVAAMCDVTGIDLHVGGGIQKFIKTNAQSAGAAGVVVRPLRPVYVASPSSEVRRALSQILDSALQRTPCGGAVGIDLVHEDDGYATIWIRDSGLEMQSELLGSLGEPADLHASFEEQDALSALQRIKNGQPAGLGLLGLKMATDAAAKAGGHLSVHPWKRGTGVCIKLPLAH
eukprot:jgi/Tetstr1/429477/TSEL_019385.t1